MNSQTRHNRILAVCLLCMLAAACQTPMQPSLTTLGGPTILDNGEMAVSCGGFFALPDSGGAALVACGVENKDNDDNLIVDVKGVRVIDDKDKGVAEVASAAKSAAAFERTRAASLRAHIAHEATTLVACMTKGIIIGIIFAPLHKSGGTGGCSSGGIEISAEDVVETGRFGATYGYEHLLAGQFFLGPHERMLKIIVLDRPGSSGESLAKPQALEICFRSPSANCTKVSLGSNADDVSI